ncbi:MAG: ATP-binding cassette domain-containing protein [Candidatus Eisenbacteria bacterium]|nr:ATP-binding cassette domain-containing protein [Candidatus Eisenbacteria bacterium]
MASVEFVGVRKDYQPGVPVLHRLDLAAVEGELLVLVGPSGCGKSTVLRLLAGLEEPTEGDIRIGGRSVVGVAPGRRDVAMVFQNYALYPHMSVRDNLSFGLKVRKIAGPEIERRVNATAGLLGLTEYLDRRPRALSGGQRQRVALGRALVREPQVFLLDEPLSNLDAQLRLRMRSEIKQLHARVGVTMVYVTHDQVEAMSLGHRVAVLKDGWLQQLGTPDEIYAHPANAFVAGFLGSPQINMVDCEASGGALVAAGTPVDVPGRPAWPEGTRLRLGLRPESVRLGDTGMPADVLWVEHLGHEAWVWVVRSEAPPVVGQQVRLGWNWPDAHWFDRDSGARMNPA